ncbi:MAG: WYL domain-containing protein [Thermoguttaceae bacterium]|nr:WYL domain-containing protein [Thermoguttaceae bacterium]
MAYETPLVRQWTLLRVLCARHYGATVREMAEEMGVSEKTIRRDLDTFARVGFPLTETLEGHGRKKYSLDHRKDQPGLSFAFDEAIALYMGRQLLEPLAGTPFWNAAQRAFKKIRASLSTEALRYIGRFAGMFHQTTVGASDYTRKAELIDELMVGIEDRRATFITYQSLQATEPVTYDIYPYGLAYHRGSLYLVGWAPEHEQLRHWKVDRIEDAEVTEFRFERPKDFDLSEHFAKTFGVFQGDGQLQRVTIRFSSTVARYVQEGAWHPSQKLSPQPDGGVLAEFDLSSTEEIKRWVLGFGRHAEVLSPGSLRDEMAEELSAMKERYITATPIGVQDGPSPVRSR